MITASVAGSGGRLSGPGGAKLLLQLSNARLDGGIAGRKASILPKKSTLTDIALKLEHGSRQLLIRQRDAEPVVARVSKRGGKTPNVISKALSFFGRLTDGLVRRKRRGRHLECVVGWKNSKLLLM